MCAIYPEVGSPPTIELQLDKFHAPISSGLTKHITPAKTPGAPYLPGRVEDYTGTPLATNICGMQDMTCVCVNNIFYSNTSGCKVNANGV